jgi:hypothetical protein
MSSGGLALEESVDEVCSFKGPSFRDVGALELSLSAQDLVSDLAAVSATVRPLALHELINQNSNRK